jgi:hypothetical protein
VVKLLEAVSQATIVTRNDLGQMMWEDKGHDDWQHAYSVMVGIASTSCNNLEIKGHDNWQHAYSVMVGIASTSCNNLEFHVVASN